MELTIRLTAEDLARLSKETVQELLGITRSKAVDVVSHDGNTVVGTALIPVERGGSRTIHERLSTEEVFALIREKPGITVHDLAARLYQPRVAQTRVAVTRVHAHITRLIQQELVHRKEHGDWRGPGRAPTQLFPVVRKKS